MRRILLSTVKILISAALLYFALRKVDLYDLASRFNIASLGWIGLAIAVMFLQIFLGVLRWREISAECGAPLATTQAMRFNLIGTFFNQTLPSSIGGDAVRLWLVARGGAGWRAATYSIFVDRAIGLIALAIVIVASLPWSYRLINDPDGRSALLLVDFAALAGGVGFLVLGRLPWPWLKRWWGTHHLHACSVIANRVIFSREARAENCGAVAAGSRPHRRHRLVRGAIDRRARAVRPGLSAGAAGDADHDAADLDRRLGRPRGHHGAGVRLCRAWRPTKASTCRCCSARYPSSSAHSAGWYGFSAPKKRRRARRQSRFPSSGYIMIDMTTSELVLSLFATASAAVLSRQHYMGDPAVAFAACACTGRMRGLRIAFHASGSRHRRDCGNTVGRRSVITLCWHMI